MTYLEELKLIEKSLLKPSPPIIWSESLISDIRGFKMAYWLSLCYHNFQKYLRSKLEVPILPNFALWNKPFLRTSYFQLKYIWKLQWHKNNQYSILMPWYVAFRFQEDRVIVNLYLSFSALSIRPFYYMFIIWSM